MSRSAENLLDFEEYVGVKLANQVKLNADLHCVILMVRLRHIRWQDGTSRTRLEQLVVFYGTGYDMKGDSDERTVPANPHVKWVKINYFDVYSRKRTIQKL